MTVDVASAKKRWMRKLKKASQRVAIETVRGNMPAANAAMLDVQKAKDELSKLGR